MKKIIFLFILSSLLTSCDFDNEILCKNEPHLATGNLQLINYQCMKFSGDHVIAFVEIEDKRTKKHFNYTANVVDHHIVFNLDTSSSIQISNSEKARNSAQTAATMSSAAFVMSTGRR